MNGASGLFAGWNVAPSCTRARRWVVGVAMLGCCAMAVPSAPAQDSAGTDPATAPATAPVWRGGPANTADYPFPYRVPTPEQIGEVLARVHAYVDAHSPAQLVDRETNEPITDFSSINPNAIFQRREGGFQLVSYEWGVTYCGMIHAWQATGDPKYRDYVDQRLNLVASAKKIAPPPPERGGGGRGGRLNFRSMINPRSLDDSGSMCAAMIKARAADLGPDMLDQINIYMNWISSGQMRLSDGTLARNRPHNDTLWLDDLYMSVPALAHMGKLTGERRYYDDAAKQILQFGRRMFIEEKGLWAHGWVGRAEEHPAFHWGRANGWAAMAITELLEVLPEDHPQRTEVMRMYRIFMRGLAKHQSPSGLWHQVLDRNDSYLETSCAAMFAYAMARGINRGWLDPFVYGPPTLLAWNGIATKVNAQGQVEGTCVATDMGFDYAFYYYRPTSPAAPHGYGPVLLAGAEVINLVKSREFRVAFSALNYVEPGYTPPFGGGARPAGAADQRTGEPPRR